MNVYLNVPILITIQYVQQGVHSRTGSAGLHLLVTLDSLGLMLVIDLRCL